MQGIVIQGPTNYHHKEVADFYSQFDNVVWSTWKDEPKKNLDYIRDRGITVIESYKPDYFGYLNVNLQCKSTLKGIEYFKERGFSEVIKVRSDIVFWGIERILEKLKGKEVAFIALHNAEKLHFLAYYLDYYHHGMDFPCDYIVFGSIESMHTMFDYQAIEHMPVPPESIILRNFLTYKGIDTMFDFDHLVNNGIYFFINDCIEQNASILWLKKNPVYNMTYAITNSEREYYLF